MGKSNVIRLEKTPKGKPNADFGLAYMRPEMAVEFLASNTMNRQMCSRNVERYADDMNAGRWHFTGIPIAVDWNGTLLNGQHTLTAIVKSGKPQWVLVVRGIDPEARIAFDDGRRRTLSDNLGILGYKYAPQVQTATRWLWQYQRGDYSFRTSSKMSNSEGFNFLNENPDIHDGVQFAMDNAEYGKAIDGAGSIAFVRVVTNRHDQTLSNEYFDILYGYKGATQKNPVACLRKALLDAKAESIQKSVQMHRSRKIALYCKAYNLLAKGQEVSYARFQAMDEFEPIIEKGAK